MQKVYFVKADAYKTDSSNTNLLTQELIRYNAVFTATIELNDKLTDFIISHKSEHKYLFDELEIVEIMGARLKAEVPNPSFPNEELFELNYTAVSKRYDLISILPDKTFVIKDDSDLVRFIQLNKTINAYIPKN